MRLPRRSAPSMRGQMAVVILVAVIAVVTLGRVSEALRDTYLSIEDTDQIADLATLVTHILTDASDEERRWLVERARTPSFDPALLDTAELDGLGPPALARTAAERWLNWLFPFDGQLPAGGRQVEFEGRLAFAIPLDERTTLLIRNLPSLTSTSDFLTPLTYYLLSIITLIVLFSFYGARAISGPLDRIVDELDRTDGVAEDRHFEETGTIEVVKLARALNGMRERIRNMVDMRMRMLRSVSHDLRTPLTRLRLRAERLEDAALRQSMTADIDGIDALVTETLDYLRVDAQGEPLERVDVSSLLQTIQADFADVGFDVRYQGPDRLVAACRPVALARAVTNLCDNAVKFGTSVTIYLSRLSEGLRIDIADDGPGIPADKRALVLEPFFKLDAARGAGAQTGFGLGLSIVADIARAHGGRVEFHDRAPHGLIVRLVLPVQAA
ncbi:ATP-binding protein [Aureimonas mangrovi]|uniref:ATP-binding protein n=1 Tax=Aureimonas mangrovi TaxID=2758041 RepID=UPI00163DC28B|nr:ATP-binding protein [Aureimonas mangrovi]